MPCADMLHAMMPRAADGAHAMARHDAAARLRLRSNDASCQRLITPPPLRLRCRCRYELLLTTLRRLMMMLPLWRDKSARNVGGAQSAQRGQMSMAERCRAGNGREWREEREELCGERAERAQS